MNIRMQTGDVVLCQNGKWSISLETWVGVPGQEHLLMKQTSAALFASEDAAYTGAERWLDHIERKLPAVDVLPE